MMTTPDTAALLAEVEAALAELDAARGNDRINNRAEFDRDLDVLRRDHSSHDRWTQAYLDAVVLWENALAVARPDTVPLYRALKRALGEGVVETGKIQ